MYLMSPQHFPASLSSTAVRVDETHFSFAIFGFFDGGLDGGGDMDDEMTSSGEKLVS